ncbi:MAG TPA: energy-coupling factor ABC transporter permease [Bacillota bacterium]|nr:energy-coupling factor ABC transporter permease [Bacillota bacterium]
MPFVLCVVSFVSLIFVFPRSAHAMHIMEGFLPFNWCVLWYALAFPFLFFGIRSINGALRRNPALKTLLGLAGAFAFVLSALKIPSLTGSCSHPTGAGLGAILFGPAAMSVLGCIVLIFQAILLAHGGLSTLGANTFSMAVAGPLVAFGIYRALQKMGAPLWLSVFLAAALGDLFTYVATSLQLALAFPAGAGGIAASFAKFMGVFALTQIPLAVSEGLLTVLVFNFLTAYSKRELQELSVFSREV